MMGLREPVYSSLPLGEVRPLGWLKDQLGIQARGLSGNLDEFWPDVAQSGWIGGAAEGWERGPYWLDGVVPLAFLLHDPDLKAKVQKWVNYIVEHQHEDGWLGPVKSAKGNYQAYDPWPVFVALKALIQWHEATNDERIPPAVERFLRRLDALLDEKPLFDWGKSRWMEAVLSIHWLYRRTGEPWLLDLAAKVKAQGFDWSAHFRAFTLTKKTKREEMSQISHVVNNAMAIKAPGVWYVQSQDPADAESVYTMIETLDRYHGQVTGVFSGDEHLAGLSPSQGTELCAVVEYMFSLEVLIGILGDPALCDRLERIAYNALPGTFTTDMWAHQYDQQANQVRANVGKHVWTTNGDDSNIFGLEPNYGCCTANMHQGWPKFAAHLWMKTAEGGLVACCYAPSRVRTTVKGGARVTITEETAYPFDGVIRFVIEPEGGASGAAGSAATGAPEGAGGSAAAFPLVLRIPAWAEGAVVRVGAEQWKPEAGRFFTLERTWRRGDVIELSLPMRVRCERRFQNSVSLVRGPIVFSLRIGEEFRQIGSFGPAKDYEVWPTTPWNYGLEIDCEDPESCVTVHTQPVSKRPFDPERPPVSLRVPGRLVPEWTLDGDYNDAAPPPPSPVRSASPREELTLIPYGSAHLRITEFPLIESR